MTSAFECDIHGRMEALFRQAQEKGLVAPDVDPRSLATVVSTLADGLFVRRAILPNFAPETRDRIRDGGHRGGLRRPHRPAEDRRRRDGRTEKLT